LTLEPCVEPSVRRQKNDGEEDRGAGAAAQAGERRWGDLRGFAPVAQRSVDPGDRRKARDQRPNMAQGR
jgi:hypothetical protein